MRFFLLTLDVFDDGLVYEFRAHDDFSRFELNHPWLYTQAELDSFMSMRREEHENEIRAETERWDRAELWSELDRDW